MTWGKGRNNPLRTSGKSVMQSEGKTSDNLPDARSFQYYGEYSESGVDISLIKYLLSLSPTDRIQLLERRAKDKLALLHLYEIRKLREQNAQ